jgi:hypothetical protein
MQTKEKQINLVMTSNCADANEHQLHGHKQFNTKILVVLYQPIFAVWQSTAKLAQMFSK